MTAVLAVRDRVYRDGRTVVAEREQMPVTANQLKRAGATWTIAKELADWRAWALKEAAEIAALLPPVTVTVQHLRKNGSGMPDTGAPYFAAKAVLDGLVDAGVLHDDGPELVVELLFLAPVIVGWHGLRVTVAETPA